MDTKDPLLDKFDTISYLMNGYCANHATHACTEVSRHIESPVKMAIAATEVVVNGCYWG